MAAVLNFLNRGRVTFDEAINEDDNYIHAWEHDRATEQLYRELYKQRDAIRALAKHHLRLGHEQHVSVAPPTKWLRGSFNICIPLHVRSGRTDAAFMMRCAMPHKLAEARYHGTVDEKVGCEVGAYVWMQDNCPSIRIRIPHLYGFGLSNGRHFTHEKQRPWYVCIVHMFRRFLHTVLRYPKLSRYTANPATSDLPTAYVLLEYIGSDTGQMLSRTWDEHRHDTSRRQRLFRGMAHIILSLARIPQPRIGSFQFHDDCSISLTNRPLTASMVILENEGAPRTVQRLDTYQCTEPFVADMIALQDNSFLSNPNAAYDDEDCRGHMATRTLIRAVSHRYIRREQRNGPFFLQLTDLHASNIFVDDEWNPTCLVDLEWICALPVEMITVPYWLTGQAINGLTDKALDEFNETRQEFMCAFEEEEQKVRAGHDVSITRVMDHGWASDGVWFWQVVDSVGGLYSLVKDHLYGRFFVDDSREGRNTEVEEMLSMLWCEDAAGMVEKKSSEYKMYADKLRVLYEVKGTPTSSGEEKSGI